MRSKKYLSLVLFIFISGCSTKFSVGVNSLATQNATDFKKFSVLSGIDGVDSKDLLFQDVTRQLEVVLLSNGYIKASEPLSADALIFLSYKIDAPKTKKTSVVYPTYGQTGVSSASTTGSVTTYGNYSTYQSSTAYMPTYGVTGTYQHTQEVTTYKRHLLLDAFDAKKYFESKELLPIWKVSVESTGSSGDLRKVIPYMIYATKKYIGKNSGEMIYIDINHGNEEVMALNPQLID